LCRYDRRKEREREWRLEELERKGVKKSKITRDKDRCVEPSKRMRLMVMTGMNGGDANAVCRDISERIALGLAAPTVSLNPPPPSLPSRL
jgi:hypothetical protein